MGLSCPHDDFIKRDGFLDLYGGSGAGAGGLLGSRGRKAGWGRRRRGRGEDPKGLRTSHDLHLLQVHHLTMRSSTDQVFNPWA